MTIVEHLLANRLMQACDHDRSTSIVRCESCQSSGHLSLHYLESLLDQGVLRQPVSEIKLIERLLLARVVLVLCYTMANLQICLKLSVTSIILKDIC